MNQECNAFKALGLNSSLVSVLEDLGFNQPTEVQQNAIPLVLDGQDVIVQSQTGTGKTAAFSLPIIQQLDRKLKQTQCLILAPTRELAIQVADAIKSFCKPFKDINICPIFGGSEYRDQIQKLRKGCQIVVGTPGRVMDHIRRGTLNLNAIKHLVLDEADEMLRMGFIDDVEWILSHVPAEKQMALFSATMPAPIKKIAQNYLQEPVELHIKHKTLTVDRINQSYAIVKDNDKPEAIKRLLEFNDFDGVIIFARTKADTQDIADKLQKSGLKAEALNGDLAQPVRKRCIDKLKNRKINIIVATDVAARGIDIERVSCVINVDVPFDHETYVHRIGRTGRAGRQGDAILLVTPKQQRLLKSLERTINAPLQRMMVPSQGQLAEKRLESFENRIIELIEKANLTKYKTLLADLVAKNNLDVLDVSAALTLMVQGNNHLDPNSKDNSLNSEFFGRGNDNKRGSRFDRRSNGASNSSRRGRSNDSSVESGMTRYKLNIGSNHGVKPGNIVGAIANEAKLSSRVIGRVSINKKFSFIDLPDDLSGKALKKLEKSKILGVPIQLSVAH